MVMSSIRGEINLFLGGAYVFVLASDELQLLQKHDMHEQSKSGDENQIW
jgi:hypothetical protein